MPEFTLPEAVRGCWYRVDPSANPELGEEADQQVVCFGADGSYRRFEPGGSGRKCVEKGDYTFDGDFLIVRARRTHTFRVNRPVFWRWELEGKKKRFNLYRGFVAGNELDEVDGELARQARLLPVRVRLEADVEGDGAIHRLWYNPEEGDPIVLAAVSMERADGGQPWVGVTSLVCGIEPEGWEQIVRHCCLDEVGDGTVTLQLFDSGQTRRIGEA